MTNKILSKAVIALTVAGAVALPASQAAAASKTESALLGALIGGVAGAAIGNGKTEGVVLGAVAGAAVGAAVDNNNDHRRYRNGYSYRTTRPYARDTRYRTYDQWVAEANNASFGAQAAYDELVPGFEALFAREGGDWQRFYDAAKRLDHVPKNQRHQFLKEIGGA